jgi:uncharacterized surface protein with fasciclin (FAS1) repeats
MQTVLAPNDDSLNPYIANNSGITTNTDAVRALIEYHIANDTHPSPVFGTAPLFPATLLNNPLYANVTGGQRVEMMLENGAPTVLSGLKAPSHLLQPDILFQGGLIHILDSVLTIPVSVPATLTGVGLNDLISLLNAGGFLQPGSIAIEIANDVTDLTIFGPNSPAYGASFTGFDTLSQADLNAMFKYGAVVGEVIYSDKLKNNTRFKTLEGSSVTITELNGGIYVDQALITTRDYLTSNGVIQVIDQPLNPNTTGTRPVITPEPTPAKVHKGLSSAAAAGIGITIGVLLLGGAIVAALIIRNRRKKRGQVKLYDHGPPRPRGTTYIPPTSQPQPSRGTVELEFHGAPPRYGAHELDNKALEGGQSGPRDPTSTTTSTYEMHRIGTTVVELRQDPTPTHTPSLRPVVNDSQDLRSNPRSTRSRADPNPPPVPVRNSTTSLGGFSLNLKAPAQGGLPPSPPNSAPHGHGGNTERGHNGRGNNGSIAKAYANIPLPPVPTQPQEIDGIETSRISISIQGEAPRHLGFQARY